MDVNVMDYGAEVMVHKAGGNEGIMDGDTLEQSGAFVGVVTGDTLWIQSGADINTYTITARTSNSVTVSGESWGYLEDVRWKITEGVLHDCTENFQDAIDAASEGGGKVYVPSGYYFFAGELIVERNAVLTGMWTLPPRWSEKCWRDGTDQGPVLCPISGMNDPAYGAPFITLTGDGENAGVEGLSIYYPLQGVVSGSGTIDVEMVQYPYCIDMKGDLLDNIPNHRILNVQLVNPFWGVRMLPFRHGDNYISGLFGTPLERGIFVDQISSFTTIEKVEFTPLFFVGGKVDETPSGEGQFITDVQTFLAAKLTAVEIQRADWLVLNDINAWIMNVGLRLRQSEMTTEWAVPVVMGTNIQFDVCDVAIHMTAGFCSLTNFRTALTEIASINGGMSVFTEQISILATEDCHLTISGGSLNGYSNKTISWDSTGWLSVSDVMFINNPDGMIDDGLYATKGMISFYNNRFQKNGETGYTNAINITSGVSSAAVYGNHFNGNDFLHNASQDQNFLVNGNIKISTNPGNNGLILESDAAGNSPFLTLKDNGTAVTDKFSMRYDGTDQVFCMGKGDANFSSAFVPQVTVAPVTGNLGVGTTTPSEKLEVSGNIKVSGEITMNTVKMLSGTVDPTTTGVTAPQGSLYMKTNGGAGSTLYYKRGSNATDWTAA